MTIKRAPRQAADWAAAGDGRWLIGGNLIVAVIILVGDGIVTPRLFGKQEASDLMDLTPSVPPPEQTGPIFLKHLDDSPEPTDEGWAAWSDHRLVAYAVLHCKNPPLNAGGPGTTCAATALGGSLST